MSSKNMVRLTTKLPPEQMDFLKAAAAREEVTIADILSRAITTERFFMEQQQKGNKLMVETPRRLLHEVIRG